VVADEAAFPTTEGGPQDDLAPACPLGDAFSGQAFAFGEKHVRFCGYGP
jgi:hypothetical protein